MMATAWPLVVVVGVGALVAVALLAGSRRARRIGRCPLNSNTVVVETQEAVWDGRSLDVIGCSEFSPRAAVRCDKRCLRDGLR